MGKVHGPNKGGGREPRRGTMAGSPVISAELGCCFADRADHATARRDPDLGRLLEAEGAAWWVCRARVGHGLVHGAGVKRAERSSSSVGKTGLTAGPAGQRLRHGMLGPSASGGRALRAERTGPPGKERSGPGKEKVGRGKRKKRERVGPSEMERTGLLGSWAGFGFLFLWVFSSFLFQTSLN